MNTYGKNPNGKQVIQVTLVSISDFNNNPENYIGDKK